MADKDGRDRIPVNVEGLRERIANAHKSALWRQLPLSKQIRALLEERLEELEKEDS